MRTRLFGSILALAVVVAVMSLAAVPAAGQTPAAEKTWTPSRLPDGQPDVRGVWGPVIGGGYSLENPTTGQGNFTALAAGKPVKNPSRVVDPADGKVPYQPWAAAKRKEQLENLDKPTKPEHIDTQNRCLLQGVPRQVFFGYQIFQPPGYVLIFNEQYHYYRVIPLDGRPQIGENIKLWMGSSRGRWEGNTLVVDVRNFNGKTRISFVGDFYSDNVHIVERFTFVDADHMNYEATIEDSKVYTRPWKIAVPSRRNQPPDHEPWEQACHEGETSSEHMLLKQ